VFVKNMPGALFWILLPLHIVFNLASFPASVFLFPERNRGKLLLRAKTDALKGLPQMWSKRRRIQAGRTASVFDIWKVLDKRIRIPVQPHVQKRTEPEEPQTTGRNNVR